MDDITEVCHSSLLRDGVSGLAEDYDFVNAVERGDGEDVVPDGDLQHAGLGGVVLTEAEASLVFLTHVFWI